MTPIRGNPTKLWRRLSWPDLTATFLAAAGLAAMFLGPAGGLFSFVKFLGLLSAGYLAFRTISWWRNRLLWSLRNRLIVAYLFIGVVPVLLLLTLAVLAAQVLYSQLGGYLLYEDFHGRLGRMADSAASIASAERTLPGSLNDKVVEEALDAQIKMAYTKELPGLNVEFHADPKRLTRIAGPNAKEFTGILQSSGQTHLIAMREVESPRGRNIVELSLHVTPDFLETIAPDLGPIQVTGLQRADGESSIGAIQLSGVRYRFLKSIATRKRTLQPATYLYDPVIEGLSKLDATYLESGEKEGVKQPIFASFTARPSVLNGRIFSALGEYSSSPILLFEFTGVILLLIGIFGLITGFVLMRAITGAVAELYGATQLVQAGDLSHKVKIERRDQLGILGESFNLMIDAVRSSIEEQKQRQRLENEISIAREVQNQLFPQRVPNVPGVEIEAICKAARTVSGDYYDFIQLSPTRIAIAIADISGKGISAALLMASLQEALRSQMLTDGTERLSTAELVARLNKHLVRNTGDDRFATFFIAVYDSATRTLRYTNAGHLPSFLICKDSALHLDKGGMVLGVVEDYGYEEEIGRA